MTDLILKDKIALITGASRGIGAAVAIKYATLGAHVILVARKSRGLEEVDSIIQNNGHEAATLVPLDLRKTEKIDQLTHSIAQRFGKLDILVGNAGILGDIAPIRHTESQSWNDTIALNLTANHRLIRNFDPLLRQAESGRAIFVTSGVTNSIHPFWGGYAVSKAGLETLVKTYAAETIDTNIRSNLIDPGATRTTMRAAAYPGEDPAKLPSPENVTQKFVELALDCCDANGEIFRA